jgi:tape measure domain-containing protein
MSETYRITLEDQVSSNAYRMAKAYADVSEAAQEYAAAVRTWDKEAIASARVWLNYNRSQLMAARAAQNAAKAIGGLGPKLNTTASSVQRLGKTAQATTHQVQAFSYSLNALAHQGMGLAFRMAGRLVDGFADAASGIYDVAVLVSRAQLSFANFFGGQVQGAKVLQETRELALKYGFDLEDTIGAMQRFGAAGFSAENSKGLLRIGADLKALGRSGQDIKGVYLALSQIKGKGVLSAEELTQQLGERGVNVGMVWQEIADKLGIVGTASQSAITKVQKLQRAGKISAAVGINAIATTIARQLNEKAFGQVGEKVANETVEGLKNRMGASFNDALFGSVMAAEPALVKGMQALMNGLTGSDTGTLQSTLAAALVRVGELMERIGPLMPEIAENFTKAFSAASGFDAGGGLNNFVDRLPELATSLGQVAGSLVVIAKALAEITGNTFAAPANKYQSDLPGASLGFDNTKGIGKVLATTPAGMVEMVGDFWGKFFASGQNITDGMKTGVEAATPAAIESVGNAAQGMIDMSDGTLQSHSPSKVFQDRGAGIAQGLALGIDADAELAMYSAQRMAEMTISAAAGAAGASGVGGAGGVGKAAGAAISSRSSSASASFGDINLNGGSSDGATVDAIRQFLETEVASIFERHLEGVGA